MPRHRIAHRVRARQVAEMGHRSVWSGVESKIMRSKKITPTRALMEILVHPDDLNEVWRVVEEIRKRRESEQKLIDDPCLPKLHVGDPEHPNS